MRLGVYAFVGGRVTGQRLGARMEGLWFVVSNSRFSRLGVRDRDEEPMNLGKGIKPLTLNPKP